ncbi:MAG TPA: ABC transporter substrate-binding protein [Candidatus Aphodocola excrementigallinarum]|uniref:ABC transporter substrate-binding protein n=1 Tax=Candidatus Aphodocola excrementigallinarum TaxID=2840670 RepID=A0A9D1IP85_9FIRM|nr:ABC transporter substrate-binding protein [Candidatus Aphodocola excrementigallinarum]
MKKKIIIIICVIIIFLVALFFVIKNNKNSKEDNNGLVTVKVAEVAHTIFYAPQYAAIANGYFEDEGINVDLTLASGADNVTAAVLSGDVDIGFCGSEATIYIYNAGEEDYLVNFARLTKRDGSFLVSREKYDDFTLDDLKGKTVIGGRKGGMPEMTFEWGLKENGIDPKNDLSIDTSVDFAAMEGTFIGGDQDFVTLFEPNATSVEKQGLGYVVGYVGEWGGEVPYTAYNAKKSYIKENKEVIEGFTNAVNKGLEYVMNTDSEKVAEDILEFFPELSLDELTVMIERYKTNDAWPNSTEITEKDFDHIQEIMQSAKELDKKAPYDKLVYQGS